MSEQTTGEPVIGNYQHGTMLAVLAASRPGYVKALAERVLDDLGEVSVLNNRTGLAMLPYRDTVHGTAFHLGEVLVAEAHIELPVRGVEGYGAVVGRDLQHAMAMAVIDAAVAAGHFTSPILEFLDAEAAHQDETDRTRLTEVEATRVHMETF